MSDAPLEPKSRREYQKHGDHTRSGRLRARGLAGIDGRTAEGREALAWRDNPLRAKGGAVHMPSRSRSSWPASIFSGSCICKVFWSPIATSGSRSSILDAESCQESVHSTIPSTPGSRAALKRWSWAGRRRSILRRDWRKKRGNETPRSVRGNIMVGADRWF